MEIGLALSGGGVRAAIFHLGVLRRLADENLLELVRQLSTVSGGSLILAALLSKSDMQWPSSESYSKHIYPSLRDLLTREDLFSAKAVGLRGIVRFNRRLLYHRADVLGKHPAGTALRGAFWI